MPPPARIGISFCTTCHHRLHQLAQTFDSNARVVAAHRDVEWVILNYASADGLDEFMTSRLRELPARIVYARFALSAGETPPAWHLSAAKNLAHRLGAGRVLANLDCDNFLRDAVEVIRAQTALGSRVIHGWSGRHRDGTHGRIALAREVFHALGGYDEALLPMGYQDGDLLARAAALGFPRVHCPCDPDAAIPNTKIESVQHCAREGLTWEDFDRRNRQQSAANITARRLIANQGRTRSTLKLEIFREGMD